LTSVLRIPRQEEGVAWKANACDEMGSTSFMGESEPGILGSRLDSASSIAFLHTKEVDVHASTRILLVLVAIGAIGGGWWTLLSINDVGVGIAYGALWTVLVLIVARLVFALGSGYNRLTAGRGQRSNEGQAGAAAALAELSDLRDRQLISAEEYEAKRAKVVERL
jgi:hypothetical protein